MLNEQSAIETLPMGEYVRIVSGGVEGKKVWINEGYCRRNKGYMLVAFSDHCQEKKLKKGTIVAHGFEY